MKLITVCPSCGGNDPYIGYLEAVNVPICESCFVVMELVIYQPELDKKEEDDHDYLRCSFCYSRKVGKRLPHCDWHCYDCSSCTSVMTPLRQKRYKQFEERNKMELNGVK
jgi:hypothetical protein